MATQKKLTALRAAMTKAQLFTAIAEDTGLTKKEIAAVFESLQDQMTRHLKKRAVGTFTLPGLAKVVVQVKAPTKARTMISPATGEEIQVAAKPRRRVVKVRALKGLKDMIEL